MNGGLLFPVSNRIGHALGIRQSGINLIRNPSVGPSEILSRDADGEKHGIPRIVGLHVGDVAEHDVTLDIALPSTSA
ncbi:hypothetical protein [Caballeronia telluris]|uniref:hypothetical protein n=1 Tax=Caballeronia telluris TaxID=326475 RepID=UPI000F739F8B|nr:hypothetical protein [Caballeronia telluris]